MDRADWGGYDGRGGAVVFVKKMTTAEDVAAAVVATVVVMSMIPVKVAGVMARVPWELPTGAEMTAPTLE